MGQGLATLTPSRPPPIPGRCAPGARCPAGPAPHGRLKRRMGAQHMGHGRAVPHSPAHGCALYSGVTPFAEPCPPQCVCGGGGGTMS